MWSELINHVKRSYKQLEVVSYIPNNGEWLNENHVSIWRGKTVWCINIQMPWRERNVSSIIYLFIFISFWYQCIFASIILWSIINNWLLFLLSITLKTLINMTWVNKPSQKGLIKQLEVVSYIPNNGKWLNENHVSFWRGKTVWYTDIQMPWRKRNVPSMIYLFIFKSFCFQCIFASIISWSIINDWLPFLLKFLFFFFIIYCPLREQLW